MRAGQRSTPIVIMKATITRHPVYNNEITEYVPIATLWASADFRKGREFYENGALITQNSMHFEVDWLDGRDLDETMRIKCDGRTYNIKALDRDLDLKRRVAIDAISGINEVQK